MPVRDLLETLRAIGPELDRIGDGLDRMNDAIRSANQEQDAAAARVNQLPPGFASVLAESGVITNADTANAGVLTESGGGAGVLAAINGLRAEIAAQTDLLATVRLG